MRIVFMGTPQFALPTLKALHSSGHEIVAVYTQPPRPAGRGQKDTPSPVHQFAAENNLRVFTPVSLKSPEAQEEFTAHKADIAVVVAYGLLLPKAILEAYPLGCINVHPSSLPRWRGAAPIQRTIMAGDKETAICIMQMDEGLDTGDILIREEEFVSDSCTAGELHDVLATEATPLVLLALEGLENGSIIPQKQSTEGVTYAKKISKDECRIDWNKSATEIVNLIRGLSPSPGAHFMYKGEKIKVLNAEDSMMNLDKLEYSIPIRPGMVLNKYFDIACGKGCISHLELQRPGKTKMFAEEMLKGFPIPPGSMLE
ncbi:MAG: methionyl-tRNA formyltransferase [Alphaproteobacteria bacterium]